MRRTTKGTVYLFKWKFLDLSFIHPQINISKYITLIRNTEADRDLGAMEMVNETSVVHCGVDINVRAHGALKFLVLVGATLHHLQPGVSFWPKRVRPLVLQLKDMSWWLKLYDGVWLWTETADREIGPWVFSLFVTAGWRHGPQRQVMVRHKQFTHQYHLPDSTTTSLLPPLWPVCL